MGVIHRRHGLAYYEMARLNRGLQRPRPPRDDERVLKIFLSFALGMFFGLPAGLFYLFALRALVEALW